MRSSASTLRTLKHYPAEYAFNADTVSCGIGLGEMNGKTFRISDLGDLTDVMVLSGLAATEIATAGLNHPIELGSGVAAALKKFRTGSATLMQSAARGGG